jgi:hypothetical protein
MHPLYATKIGYACPSPNIDPYLTHSFCFSLTIFMAMDAQMQVYNTFLISIGEGNMKKKHKKDRLSTYQNV